MGIRINISHRLACAALLLCSGGWPLVGSVRDLQAASASNDTSLQRAAAAYLHPHQNGGIVPPSKHMAAALEEAHYPWVDASGARRKAIFVVVAGLPSMNQTARTQLESLSRVTIKLDNGTVSNLARHTVAMGLTAAAVHLCQSMPWGQHCVQVSADTPSSSHNLLADMKLLMRVVQARHDEVWLQSY
jgi:hypothetical protein